LNFPRKKCVSDLAQRVEKSVTETLSLVQMTSDRVSVRYGKNVTDFGILECVTESVSLSPLQKSDGGNAPLPFIFFIFLLPDATLSHLVK
jgi:hypothetical protein